MRRRKRMLEDLDRDIRDHIERETQDNIERGLSPEEARYAALRKFGNVTRVKEETGEVWSVVWLEHLLQDMRFGLRILRKNPSFTIVAVLTLGLGIGANTAIFSVINTILLGPLPFRDSGQLVTIWQASPTLGFRAIPVTNPDFEDFRTGARSFAQMAALYLNKEDYNLTGRGEPERVAGMNVSANLFSVLGVRPEIGRAFAEGEDQPGHEYKVIVSHRLWLRKFSGDSAIIGQPVNIDGKPYSIVGVMPADFHFPPPMVSGRLTVAGERDLWLPYVMSDVSREDHLLAVLARLKAGATLAQARSEIETIARRLQVSYPKTNGDFGATVISLQEMVVGESRLALWTLLGAVGFVLLIACVNVANLLLARAAARSREMTLRAALGAAPARLVRQGLTESALISLGGGGIGILLAAASIHYLRATNGLDVPRITDVSLDRHVLAFCLGVSLLTAVLFGSVPAWFAARANAGKSLRDGRGSGGGSKARFRRTLVVAELALAMIPLAGAGLLIRSFDKLAAINPGFTPQHVLTASLRLSRQRYENDQRITNFAQQFVERVEALPGVTSAGTTNSLPISGFQAASLFYVEGRPRPTTIAGTPMANERAVTPGYFAALQIPLRRGRLLAESDRAGSSRAVIVNETVARRYFGGADPLGQQIKVDSYSADSPPWTIVGIVGDIHQAGLAEEPQPEIYFSEFQRPWSVLTIVVKSEVATNALLPAIKQQLGSIDKDLPLFDPKTMEQVMAESLSARRSDLTVMAAFAAIALLLAAIGIYGVISYSVSQRRGEIGIRMAVGAQPSQIVRLVLQEGILLVLAGTALGIVGELALTRVMSRLLYGVTPTDPTTVATTVLVLVGVAALACIVPARRAMRVDPMVALRYE